jgi:ABC-2 type transport system permease protein
MARWEDNVMNLKRLGIYWQIWKTIAKYTFAETFLNRWMNILFFAGKFIRFGMLLAFLLVIQSNINGFAGYTSNQIVVFFLTYQVIDTITQVLYRGVYIFSSQVKSGELDFYLMKPVNTLFRILTGKPDIIDAIFFAPQMILSIWLIIHLTSSITVASFLAYLLLILNGFLIATAFHIFVICLGILTTEVDNAIMLYRDTNNLARFPIDLYREPMRTALFFLVPVGLINTIPAQVLLNLTPSYSVLITLLIGGGFFLLSLLAWKESVKRYTSAGG